MEKSRKARSDSHAVLDVAGELAQQIAADMILVVADSGLNRATARKLNRVCPTLVVTRSNRFLRGVEELGVRRLHFEFDATDDVAYLERIRQGVILGMEGGYIQRGNRLVCLTCTIDRRALDTVVVVDTSQGFEGYDPQRVAALAGDLPLEVVRAVLDIAVDIGQEGREGEPVGTLFVIGDSERVLANSRVMTFDPFRGYSEREKNICNPDIREGVKEVALMDGAFVIQDDGVILSGCRYIAAAVKGLTLPKGLGARHVAAASVTNHTQSVAVAVSESSGVVRAFKRGEIVMQIDPSMRRMRQDRRH